MSTGGNESLTLAEMPPQEAAAKLRAIGENDLANAIEGTIQDGSDSSQAFGLFGIGDARSTKPWGQSGCVVGYFPSKRLDDATVPIVSVRRIVA